MVAKGEVDIALLPANLGATLYQKTKGEVVAIEINTLGVLYMVSGDKTLTSGEVTLEELEGKTIFLTGMGTTPDYALQAMAEKCGIELTLEYASEATEILALLKEEPERIALLPQPFVTSAVMQMEELSVIYDLNRGYEMLMGTPLVTGITIARKEVLDQNPDLVEEFLKQHKESTTAILADPQEGAELVVKAGILPKKEIAQKAIPNCNLTSVTGQNMKEILQPYLQQLYEMDPKVVGGAIPEDEFYYCK